MESFAQKVWDVLSHIEVAPHVEHIQIGSGKALSYVPWHKAWLLTKREFPAATYQHGQDIVHADGTMEVEVTVQIPDAAGEYFTTYARLAVMDNRFNAIANPNARDINDNRQRCLVKALAFAGLGLSLWDAGSTIPVGTLSDPITPKQLSALISKMKEVDADLDQFLSWAGVEAMSDLPQEKYASAISLLNAKLARSKQ